MRRKKKRTTQTNRPLFSPSLQLPSILQCHVPTHLCMHLSSCRQPSPAVTAMICNRPVQGLLSLLDSSTLTIPNTFPIPNFSLDILSSPMPDYAPAHPHHNQPPPPCQPTPPPPHPTINPGLQPIHNTPNPASHTTSTPLFNWLNIRKIRIVVGCCREHAGTHPLKFNIAPSFSKEFLMRRRVDCAHVRVGR